VHGQEEGTSRSYACSARSCICLARAGGCPPSLLSSVPRRCRRGASLPTILGTKLRLVSGVPQTWGSLRGLPAASRSARRPGALPPPAPCRVRLRAHVRCSHGSLWTCESAMCLPRALSGRSGPAHTHMHTALWLAPKP